MTSSFIRFPYSHHDQNTRFSPLDMTHQQVPSQVVTARKTSIEIGLSSMNASFVVTFVKER
jgi:hypothetical protein